VKRVETSLISSTVLRLELLKCVARLVFFMLFLLYLCSFQPECRHRDRQERLDRKNRDRQHRETLDGIKANKSGGDAPDLRL
jgi:hypothetical protein